MGGTLVGNNISGLHHTLDSLNHLLDNGVAAGLSYFLFKPHSMSGYEESLNALLDGCGPTENQAPPDIAETAQKAANLIGYLFGGLSQEVPSSQSTQQASQDIVGGSGDNAAGKEAQPIKQRVSDILLSLGLQSCGTIRKDVDQIVHELRLGFTSIRKAVEEAEAVIGASATSLEQRVSGMLLRLGLQSHGTIREDVDHIVQELELGFTTIDKAVNEEEAVIGATDLIPRKRVWDLHPLDII